MMVLLLVIFQQLAVEQLLRLTVGLVGLCLHGNFLIICICIGESCCLMSYVCLALALSTTISHPWFE